MCGSVLCYEAESMMVGCVWLSEVVLWRLFVASCLHLRVCLPYPKCQSRFNLGDRSEQGAAALLGLPKTQHSCRLVEIAL